MTAVESLAPLDSIERLEERLSRPTAGVLDTLRRIEGDIVVLGAGGKLGPTLARMARRGCDEIGDSRRRVIAVSRFSSPRAAESLQAAGVETIACDLLDRDAVAQLPDAPNMLFLAGQKFGTQDRPERTWVANTVLPAIAIERYRHARCVALSTGCVYPLVAVDGPGADESAPLTPPGEYANSCVGRERVLSCYALEHGTPLALVRLCYAIDLRYGVLLDIARQVQAGEPVSLGMGWTHVLWQGDANARILQSLERAAVIPTAAQLHSHPARRELCPARCNRSVAANLSGAR